MLIRSQEEKSFVNMDNIFSVNIYELDGNFIIDATNNIGTETLGLYSSEAKANKVIGCICSAYDNCVNDTAKAMRGDWIRTVYDMPKDEDVVISK